LDYQIFPFVTLNENCLHEEVGIAEQTPIFPLRIGEPDEYRIFFYSEPNLLGIRHIIKDHFIGEPINWNDDWDSDDFCEAVDITGDSQNDEILRVSTEWDKLVFKGIDINPSGSHWNIGKEASTNSLYETATTTALYHLETTPICCDSPKERYFSPYSFIIAPYKEGSIRIQSNAGSVIPFAVYIYNHRKVGDDYQIQVTNTEGWNTDYVQNIHLDSGHRRVAQIMVDIPDAALKGTINKFHIMATSNGNETLSEGMYFYVEIAQNSFIDSDMDNISDINETIFGTDPNNPDTDNDGIYDGIEIIDYSSSEDSDGDGLIDALDSDNIISNDTDNDGVSDSRELALGLNPNNSDSDGDGINDSLEIGRANENLPPIDYDRDGIIDAFESSTDAYNNNSIDNDLDGFTEEEGDCSDYSPSIYPGANEVPYDDTDQDCDGYDLTDVDGDGFDSSNVGGNDCDDENEAINPDAAESCDDNIDNNCDGQIDEGCISLPGDLNSDGVVDRNDVNILKLYINRPASVYPECDIDGDGTITVLDARKIVTMCTCPRCVCP
jgi:hypothetical protein